MENILDSIKKLMGIDETDITFDQELIMHINSVFMVLNQLGVGPVDGFKIYSNEETWSDFIINRLDMESIKSYVYLKVRLLFDPPQNSFLVESINKQIQEYEWRLNVQVEPYAITEMLKSSEENNYNDIY
jgi:hypothetical protein